MPSANERKQRPVEPEHKPGRTSRVKVYTIKGSKGEKVRRNKVHPSYQSAMAKPKGLSAEARFEMLKPPEIHPLDWFRLFTPEEELWEAIREEAIEAIGTGEMKRYDGPVGR